MKLYEQPDSKAESPILHTVSEERNIPQGKLCLHNFTKHDIQSPKPPPCLKTTRRLEATIAQEKPKEV
ncbi:hypothetical protein J6590_062619 [Homalodisca vitripennis]|nr:hypothetical protein J6590_062619 [Homalodisca vitripennis]